MTGERQFVCMSCLHEVDLDGPELARTLARIDKAVKVIDDAAAELRMPSPLESQLAGQRAPTRIRLNLLTFTASKRLP